MEETKNSYYDRLLNTGKTSIKVKYSDSDELRTMSMFVFQQMHKAIADEILDKLYSYNNEHPKDCDIYFSFINYKDHITILCLLESIIGSKITNTEGFQNSREHKFFKKFLNILNIKQPIYYFDDRKVLKQI